MEMYGMMKGRKALAKALIKVFWPHFDTKLVVQLVNLVERHHQQS